MSVLCIHFKFVFRDLWMLSRSFQQFSFFMFSEINSSVSSLSFIFFFIWNENCLTVTCGRGLGGVGNVREVGEWCSAGGVIKGRKWDSQGNEKWEKYEKKFRIICTNKRQEPVIKVMGSTPIFSSLFSLHFLSNY